MNIHIALYKWKPEATPEQVTHVLQDIESLATKVPGILDITAGENTSKYNEGYTHVLIRVAACRRTIDER